MAAPWFGLVHLEILRKNYHAEIMFVKGFRGALLRKHGRKYNKGNIRDNSCNATQFISAHHSCIAIVGSAIPIDDVAKIERQRSKIFDD